MNRITNWGKRMATLLVIIQISMDKMSRSLMSLAKPNKGLCEELDDAMDSTINPCIQKSNLTVTWWEFFSMFN